MITVQDPDLSKNAPLGEKPRAAPPPVRLPRRVRFAVFVAGSNVVGLALGAVLTVASGLTPVSLFGVAFAALAWNEWRGRTLLLAAEPHAPRHLALNQLFLFLVVILYCAHGAYSAWTGMNAFDEALLTQPEVAEALREGLAEKGLSQESLGIGAHEMAEWSRNALLYANGVIAVGSLIVQGLTAALYLSLRRTLAAQR
jgi:hypothetical protein